MDDEQLLARIVERYGGTAVVAQSVNRSNGSVAHRDPSDHANELSIVRFEGARSIIEHSLNCTGGASVANQNASASHGANELVMAQPLVCTSPVITQKHFPDIE